MGTQGPGLVPQQWVPGCTGGRWAAAGGRGEYLWGKRDGRQEAEVDTEGRTGRETEVGIKKQKRNGGKERKGRSKRGGGGRT